MLFRFFFNDTATPEIYTLSLHDALPISQDVVMTVATDGGELYASERQAHAARCYPRGVDEVNAGIELAARWQDRKSTRLNSSHSSISYAVFCLKKKTKQKKRTSTTTTKQ